MTRQYNKLLPSLARTVVALLFVFPIVLFTLSNHAQSFLEYFIRSPKSLHDQFFTWSSANLGGSNTEQLWRLPLSAYYYALNVILHIPASITQAILLAIFFGVGFYSFLLLCKKIFETSKITFGYWVGALFFCFNVYTLTQLSHSFLLILPYLVLPLQLLLFIKSLETKSINYIILLSLVSSSVFGINLVFSFIAIVLMLSYGIWLWAYSKQIKPRSLAKVGVISLLLTMALTAWWLLPLIHSSLLDKSNTSYILSSETFYNLDSTPVKVVRGLGEWSFFGGYRGSLYYAFSSAYAKPVLLVATYLIPVLCFGGYFFLRRLRAHELHKRLLYFYVLAVVTIPIIGGTYKSWPTSGAFRWAFKNIPYFEAFRNTYKWASLLMLAFALMLIIPVQTMVGFGNLKPRFKALTVSAISLILGLIVLTAFPFWLGHVYPESSSIKKLPSYWLQMANFVNAPANQVTGRIFELPNQYFDAYNWDGKLFTFQRNVGDAIFKPPVIFNTCNGCGQAYSSTLIKSLYSHLDLKNIDQFFGLINISNIVQRNDYQSSYYNVEDPSKIKSILESYNSSKLTKSVGQLDLYAVNRKNVYPNIYSPGSMYVTQNLTDTLDLFDEYPDQDKLSFIYTDYLKAHTNPVGNFYSRLFKEDSVSVEDGNLISSVEIPTTDTYKVVQRAIVNHPPSQALYFAKNTPPQTDLSQLKLTPGQYKFGVPIHEGTKNLLSNGSFEEGSWSKEVSNCQVSDPKIPLGMRLSSDKTDGNQSLELSADGDSACAYSSAITEFSKQVDYELSFDYKVVKGSKAAICVWDGESCLLYKAYKNNSDWTHVQTAFEPHTTSSQVVIFLYAPTENNQASVVRYDNVKVLSLGEKIISTFAIESAQSKTTTSAKISTVTNNPTSYTVRTSEHSPFNLILQQTYHPGWRVVVSAAGTKQRYSISTNQHFVANGYGNGWRIDPGQFPANLREQKSYLISIQFTPQRWFYVGLIISGVTLVGCLSYVIYDWRRRKLRTDY